MSIFSLQSNYIPAGDQPNAINNLVDGLRANKRIQTLLGATGTGKTFTMANVITQIEKPTLVIAHNKTLAAQLAQEFREFFPTHAVHYFVSYYDYYQPEAYMPITDTYIEKDASINEEIDRLRHASTQALLTRKDVIIVASVSCIYGLGSPEEYKDSHLLLQVGQKVSKREVMEKLVKVHYERTNADLSSGTFRSLGNKVEIVPVSETTMRVISFAGDVIESITVVDVVSSRIIETVSECFIFPAKHFLTDGVKKEKALISIQQELEEQIQYLKDQGLNLEAERIQRRTTYDLAMIREVGYCSGIENYSRHLSGKNAGDPPETLLSYFPHTPDGKPDFLTVIDESHVTLPQLSGMYAGDASRKKTLVEHGFRLPSAKDNRPLRYEEFEKRIGQVIYVSATPGNLERTTSEQIVEQIIRPTGLIDPVIEIRPLRENGAYHGQVHDFIAEAQKEIAAGRRVLATTLTKRMAEDLNDYLKDKKIKSTYVHSDVKTMERIQILTDFRRGVYDILVGVNLLREGLDLPEVSLIGILDADKAGFLRSETSLIQTIGRAARNIHGRVILYADLITDAMKKAIDETDRRRSIQLAYNKKHGITPKTIEKNIKDITETIDSLRSKTLADQIALDESILKDAKKLKKYIKVREREMNEAVKLLDFETAALLRDEIRILQEKMGK
jgi:excinuclease ABC subunit B